MSKRFGISRGSGILFLFPVGAQALITLGSIPLIIRSAGDDGWASIAVGQAVGSVCAVIGGLGWNVTGPSQIAAADERWRSSLLRLAVFTRMAVFIPLAIVGFFIAYLLCLPFPELAMVAVITTLVLGFNMQWYFIGMNAPGKLFIYDSVPRIFIMLAGWLCVFAGSDVLIGLVGQVLASIIPLSLVYLKFGRCGEKRKKWTLKAIGFEILSQRHGLSNQVLPAILSYSPLMGISILAPSIAPLYALIDKMHKQLVTGLVPIGNMVVAKLLQNFARGKDHLSLVARKTMMKLGILSLLSSLVTSFISAPLIGILSRNTMQLSATLVVLLSILVGLTVLVALLPAGLMAPTNLLSQASISLFWGASIGVVAVGSFAFLWGAGGALLGQILGYGLAITLQWNYVRKIGPS